MVELFRRKHMIMIWVSFQNLDVADLSALLFRLVDFQLKSWTLGVGSNDGPISNWAVLLKTYDHGMTPGQPFRRSVSKSTMASGYEDLFIIVDQNFLHTDSQDLCIVRFCIQDFTIGSICLSSRTDNAHIRQFSINTSNCPKKANFPNLPDRFDCLRQKDFCCVGEQHHATQCSRTHHQKHWTCRKQEPVVTV